VNAEVPIRNSVITVRFYGTARPSTITEWTLSELSMPANPVGEFDLNLP
jgi:hypothetical protein